MARSRRQSLEAREERKAWDEHWRRMALGTERPACGYAKYLTGLKDSPRWRRYVCAITGQVCACTYHSRRVGGAVFASNHRECPGRAREWHPVREAPIMLPKEVG